MRQPLCCSLMPVAVTAPAPNDGARSCRHCCTKPHTPPSRTIATAPELRKLVPNRAEGGGGGGGGAAPLLLLPVLAIAGQPLPHVAQCSRTPAQHASVRLGQRRMAAETEEAVASCRCCCRCGRLNAVCRLCRRPRWSGATHLPTTAGAQGATPPRLTHVGVTARQRRWRRPAVAVKVPVGNSPADPAERGTQLAHARRSCRCDSQSQRQPPASRMATPTRQRDGRAALAALRCCSRLRVLMTPRRWWQCGSHCCCCSCRLACSVSYQPAAQQRPLDSDTAQPPSLLSAAAPARAS